MAENDKPTRGRPRRTWVKMHVDGCLHGSINYQLALEEQAIWFKLIMYSAVCGGPPGWISDNDRRPLPLEFLADELHAPVEVVKSTVEKCVKEGRIKQNAHGLHIVNWDAYQSEYQRQKPYREGKGGKAPAPEGLLKDKKEE